MVNNVLDLSKIEADKMELEEIPFVLRDVVENSIQIVGFTAESKKLDIFADIDASVPLQVVGDPTR